MRIATMTNWAYVITVGLTIASGIAMLMASGADRAERQAVQQRDTFVRLADEVERDAWELSGLARLYVIENNRRRCNGIASSAELSNQLKTDCLN